MRGWAGLGWAGPGWEVVIITTSTQENIFLRDAKMRSIFINNKIWSYKNKSKKFGAQMLF